MNKPLLLLMAPVTTVSGYGARSRDIATALIKSDKYNIKIFPTRWGSTPMNALDASKEADKAIMDRLMAEPKLDAQPDIFIQVTVPNEFQTIGKFNIGITAGIETTACSVPWIEGCNRMDLILTSSEHSKTVFMQSMFEQLDSNTKAKVGELRVTKPVEVLFEGIDLDAFHKTNVLEESVTTSLKKIKEQDCFLYVGHWLNGSFGEDRKNTSGLVRAFLEAFKNKQTAPALILKTSTVDFSPIDRLAILQKLESIRASVVDARRLPSIYLLHGDMTQSELNSLYNHPKVKAHITFTKGEGYGRPLAEAALSAKPVIASNWSGHLDFLKHGVLLPGCMTQVHESAAWENVILKEASWFSVDYGFAVRTMQDVYKNPKKYENDAKKQATLIRKEFSLDMMKEKLIVLLDERLPKFAQPMQLKLPQLRKIEKPKLTKITADE